MLDRSGVSRETLALELHLAELGREMLPHLAQLADARVHVGVEVPGERHDPAGQVLKLVTHDSDDDT
jgi:hypothetical protein